MSLKRRASKAEIEFLIQKMIRDGYTHKSREFNGVQTKITLVSKTDTRVISYTGNGWVEIS